MSTWCPLSSESWHPPQPRSKNGRESQGWEQRGILFFHCLPTSSSQTQTAGKKRIFSAWNLLGSLKPQKLLLPFWHFPEDLCSGRAIIKAQASQVAGDWREKEVKGLPPFIFTTTPHDFDLESAWRKSFNWEIFGEYRYKLGLRLGMGSGTAGYKSPIFSAWEIVKTNFYEKWKEEKVSFCSVPSFHKTFISSSSSLLLFSFEALRILLESHKGEEAEQEGRNLKKTLLYGIVSWRNLM